MHWNLPPEIELPEGFQTAIGGHPLVSEIVYRRGIHDKENAMAFLDSSKYRPSPASEMPDIAKAVDIIMEAIKKREKICVWGDFDVDGQTATTILVSGLKKLGAEVVFHIPNRAKESHGIKIPYLQEVLKQDIQVLLTCDTGISEVESIAYAKKHEIKTIITDHHEIPQQLPPADAIVDPKLLGSNHPLTPLSGAAIAYKLIEALDEQFHRGRECDEDLDLVALSLIADVAPLSGDARYLAQIGLEKLRTTTRQGLLQLLSLSGTLQQSITEEHIGFAIAPRLNALGRLSDANSIVEFYTTPNVDRARILANQLEGLNNKRKLITEQIYQAALSKIENDPSVLEHAALVLSHSAWHPGIIGLVASRLVEQYYKPVILLCTPADSNAHGSARSIEGVDITSAISQNQNLLLGFGGHPMAAGLSLPVENIASFRKALSKTIHQMVDVDQLKPEISIDAFIPLPELTLDFADEMERLAPFGAANPSLTFACENLMVTGQKYLGREEKHLQLTVADPSGNHQKVIWWRANDAGVPKGKFDLAYHMRSNSYSGNRELSLIWVDSRPARESIPLLIKTKPSIEIIDHRKDPQPLPVLQKLLHIDSIQIWSESASIEIEQGKKRQDISSCDDLVVWTIPPSMDLLTDIVKTTKPRRLYLFSVQPEITSQEQLLTRLSAHVKFALSKQNGEINMVHLAGATAQRVSAVRVGMNWLEENGYISINEQTSETIHIKTGNRQKGEYSTLVLEQLKSILKETSAFRSYYTKTHLDFFHHVMGQ